MALQKFSDLDAWRKAHKLALFVYATTKNFPDDERFGLVSQMRRAAISVTSNIAEGFGRKSIQDKVHFYTMAKTSLSELENQFVLAHDLKYAPNASPDSQNQIEEVHKLIGGLIKSAAPKPS